MHAAPHLSDEQIADYSLLDGDQPEAADGTGGHLQSCAPCAARLAELARMVSLFRGLPDESPPRDFRLGPRLLGQAPPRAHRLVRMYTWTRAAAASAAAISILLFGADLALPPGAATSVLQSPPSAPTAPPGRPAESARSAPAPALQTAPSGDQSRGSAAAPAVRAARPAAGGTGTDAGPAPAPPGSAPNGSGGSGGTAPAPAPAGSAGAGAAEGPATSSQAAAPADVGDQRAAATGVQPLPAPPADGVAAFPVAGNRGPYRFMAGVAAVLALAAAVAAVVVRSRLTRTIVPPHSTPGGHPS